jgi:hypothetical protein
MGIVSLERSACRLAFRCEGSARSATHRAPS